MAYFGAIKYSKMYLVFIIMICGAVPLADSVSCGITVSKKDPSSAQKPTSRYPRFFSEHIWSWLLCSPVTVSWRTHRGRWVGTSDVGVTLKLCAMGNDAVGTTAPGI